MLEHLVWRLPAATSAFARVRGFWMGWMSLTMGFLFRLSEVSANLYKQGSAKLSLEVFVLAYT
jgi:hypothetical protein